MTMDPGWTALRVPEMDRLPGLVVPRFEEMPPHSAFPNHVHRWNQFIHATSGTLQVSVEGARHVITPEQAIWVPTGVLHDTRAPEGAAFRNLYVVEDPALGLTQRCAVSAMTPLLRELIQELAGMENRGEPPAYGAQIQGLILEQLRRLTPQDFHLPWPRSAALQRLCDALSAAPDDVRSLDSWAETLALTPRTLTRRFQRETGLTIRAWRRRLRLFKAMEWLGNGRGVTEIALDLGYASPSAFTYMFRQEMGKSPSEWLKR
ncbi:MAG: helix-turn-helix transcriptional regulator [Rhodospirillum sp.]|nr:helix-turn-helix transcriptional regulator [Rhodospirillum sp.]MCF8490852.1 helix-turn-helix transcriptional regulator [Rhodospirillum sp.]MCF8501921.1 helix-turn-helix transcriptional regulator [Rhodospirillum sp.]